jgi:hypothetical protein
VVPALEVLIPPVHRFDVRPHGRNVQAIAELVVCGGRLTEPHPVDGMGGAAVGVIRRCLIILTVPGVTELRLSVPVSAVQKKCPDGLFEGEEPVLHLMGIARGGGSKVVQVRAPDTLELRLSADQEVTRPMRRPTLRYGCEGWASFCLILDAGSRPCSRTRRSTT